MMKIEDEHLDDRDRELFVGHLVTWGAIIMALVLAITLTHFSSAENDKGDSPAQAEAAS
tara:strand:+ start:1969 stop:2145 length:177 start_codon:yes stop_codon:yes gene_type:complete